MGISRDSRHKRSASGARRAHYRKKRKFELGRQAAMTKLDTTKRIHTVRTRGGNVKYRAIRLDTGNFSWGSEATTRKTRLLNVVSRIDEEEGQAGYKARTDGRAKRTLQAICGASRSRDEEDGTTGGWMRV